MSVIFFYISMQLYYPPEGFINAKQRKGKRNTVIIQQKAKSNSRQPILIRRVQQKELNTHVDFYVAEITPKQRQGN